METVTVDSVSAETLRQGIQFLYAQASEVLRRRRERRREAATPEPAADIDDTVVEGGLKPTQIDYEALEQLESGIRELSLALEQYATGTGSLERASDDPNLLKLVEGLRRSLEVVLRQPIVFRGEKRPHADVDVSLDVKDVQGYVAGIVGDSLGGSRIKVSIEGENIGGTVIGIAKGPTPPKSSS